MAIAGVVNGNDVLFEVHNGTEFVPFVCAKDVSIETTNEKVKVTTVGDGFWDKWRDQAIGYSISLSGVTRLIAADELFTVFHMLAAQINFLDIHYRLILPSLEGDLVRIFRGYAQVERSSISGNTGSASLADFTLRGNGAYEVLTCGIEIGSVEVTGEGSGDRTVTLTDIEGGTPASFIYQLNEGFEHDVNTNPFTVAGPFRLFRDNTLLVFPICADGGRGQSISTDFFVEVEIVGPQPGETNYAVFGLNLINETTTSMDAIWQTVVGAAPTGYEVTVTNITTNASYTITVAGDPVNLTGLTPDTEYRVRVVALYGTERSQPVTITSRTLVASEPVIPNPNKVIHVRNIGNFNLYLNGNIAANQSVNRFIHTGQRFELYSVPTISDIVFSLKFYNNNINLNYPGWTNIADHTFITMPDPAAYTRIEIDSDSDI